MIKITTAQHAKTFTSPAVAWEWLRKQRPQKHALGSSVLRMWLQSASAGQSMHCQTKHGATRLEVTE